MLCDTIGNGTKAISGGGAIIRNSEKVVHGDIKVEGGTKEDVLKFFTYFGRPVDVGSINLIVR